MSRVQLTVRVERALAIRLEERAADLGIEPDELLDAALRGLLPEVAEPGRRIGDVILGLVREGLCDAEIAGRTGMLVGHVAEVRRAAGLPANRRYPHRD